MAFEFSLYLSHLFYVEDNLINSETLSNLLSRMLQNIDAGLYWSDKGILSGDTGRLRTWWILKFQNVLQKQRPRPGSSF